MKLIKEEVKVELSVAKDGEVNILYDIKAEVREGWDEVLKEVKMEIKAKEATIYMKITKKHS